MRAIPGTSSRRSSSRFAVNSAMKKLIPVMLPPGRARLATRPSLTGSALTVKTMGIVVVAALAANAEAGEPPATITATCRRTKFGRQRRQSIHLIFGPAVFDRDVLALDMAGFFEALAKCAQAVGERVGRCAVEKPDHRHRRLLRARRKRPRAAAPPSSVMNSRRLIRSPRRR